MTHSINGSQIGGAGGIQGAGGVPAAPRPAALPIIANDFVGKEKISIGNGHQEIQVILTRNNKIAIQTTIKDPLTQVESSTIRIFNVKRGGSKVLENAALTDIRAKVEDLFRNEVVSNRWLSSPPADTKRAGVSIKLFATEGELIQGGKSIKVMYSAALKANHVALPAMPQEAARPNPGAPEQVFPPPPPAAHVQVGATPPGQPAQQVQSVVLHSAPAALPPLLPPLPDKSKASNSGPKANQPPLPAPPAPKMGPPLPVPPKASRVPSKEDLAKPLPPIPQAPPAPAAVPSTPEPEAAAASKSQSAMDAFINARVKEAKSKVGPRIPTLADVPKAKRSEEAVPVGNKPMDVLRRRRILESEVAAAKEILRENAPAEPHGAVSETVDTPKKAREPDVESDFQVDETLFLRKPDDDVVQLAPAFFGAEIPEPMPAATLAPEAVPSPEALAPPPEPAGLEAPTAPTAPAAPEGPAAPSAPTVRSGNAAEKPTQNELLSGMKRLKKPRKVDTSPQSPKKVDAAPQSPSMSDQLTAGMKARRAAIAKGERANQEPTTPPSSPVRKFNVPRGQTPPPSPGTAAKPTGG